MHIGLSRPPTPPHGIPDVDGALVARIAEDVGFESLFYGEHPVTPAEDPGHAVHSSGVPFFQDTLVMLSRASAVTSTIKLGAAVFLLPVHHPVMFAKQLASLDFYSGGRLIVGIGTGWSRVECEACGGNFERRWTQTREGIEVMKKLWTTDGAGHHGEFFQFEPISIDPKPVSRPWPPIVLPGPPWYNTEPLDSPKVIKYFQRIAKHADGWLPVMLGSERMEAGVAMLQEGRRLLDRLCTENGRDPAEVTITALLRTEVHDGDTTFPELVSRDVLRRYEDLGIERALVTMPTITDEASTRSVLTRMGELLL